MLDLKAQSRLVDATSALMRAYFAAAAQGWTASASRGLAMWVDMLGASRRGIADAWPRPSLAPWLASEDRPAVRRQQDAATGSTLCAGFSSYRSDSGHAVAQIVAPESGLNTPLDPVHAMLGFRRTALGG